MSSQERIVEQRVEPAEAFGLWLGYACIVLGGVAAAVTGPLAWREGSWLAAYLVLVGGMAQLAFAWETRLLRAARPAAVAAWWRVVLWPIGNALVVAGALLRQPFVADAGGVVLVAGLVVAALHTRGAQRVAFAWLVRLFFVALVASIPIGLVLSHLRAG